MSNPQFEEVEKIARLSLQEAGQLIMPRITPHFAQELLFAVRKKVNEAEVGGYKEAFNKGYEAGLRAPGNRAVRRSGPTLTPEQLYDVRADMDARIDARLAASVHGANGVEFLKRLDKLEQITAERLRVLEKYLTALMFDTTSHSTVDDLIKRMNTLEKGVSQRLGEHSMSIAHLRTELATGRDYRGAAEDNLAQNRSGLEPHQTGTVDNKPKG